MLKVIRVFPTFILLVFDFSVFHKEFLLIDISLFFAISEQLFIFWTQRRF